MPALRRLLPSLLASSLGALLLTSTSRAAEITYGELAAGAISEAEQSDVRCELCRDHLFDPRRMPARLPVGYRLVTAAEYAKDDSTLAQLLESHPRYAHFVVGSLCFMSTGSFVVDGVRAHDEGTTPMAFWWARAKAKSGVKSDSSMKGRTEWVQLASWYSRTGTDSTRIRATDPMARFADLEVVPTGPNAWRMALALQGERIEATVKGDGDRKPRKSAQPGFMTVPFTGPSADRFTVFTYFGHHHQEATGDWRAKGKGVFTQSFTIPGEAKVFGTYYQDGWQARSALYPFRP